MYSFLTVIFAVFIKICLIQGNPQNYGGGRTGYAGRNSQSNSNLPPYRNDKQSQNTNTRYYDENENIYIGNGHNRQNLVILNEGNPRYFGGGNVQPKFIPKSTENHSVVNQYSNKNTLQQFSENINQKSISDFNTRRRNFIDNPQYDDQSQNSNKRYYSDDEIVSIGNGHNKNNVVILNEGPRRNFQDSIQPLFGFRNTNQRPRYDSKVVSINNIGNGRDNQNSVIIEDSPGGLGRTVTTFQNGFRSSSQVFTDKSLTYNNQKFNDPSSNSYNHGTYNRQNRDRPNSMNTFENRNRDETDYSYSQIGHGPENRNTVIINGEVYSSPGTTVVRRKDNGFRNTEIISNNGYHSFPDDENLKVLPKKNC